MSLHSIKIKLFTKNNQIFCVVFKNIPELPYMSTNLEYMNNTKTLEKIPCYICTTSVNYEYLFIINSEEPKSELITCKFPNIVNKDGYYEVYEKDMRPTNKIITVIQYSDDGLNLTKKEYKEYLEASLENNGFPYSVFWGGYFDSINNIDDIDIEIKNMINKIYDLRNKIDRAFINLNIIIDNSHGYDYIYYLYKINGIIPKNIEVNYLKDNIINKIVYKQFIDTINNYNLKDIYNELITEIKKLIKHLKEIYNIDISEDRFW